MPLSKENRRLLLLGEFFVTHTWRNLIRSLWLFFPCHIIYRISIFYFLDTTSGQRSDGDNT